MKYFTTIVLMALVAMSVLLALQGDVILLLRGIFGMLLSILLCLVLMFLDYKGE